MAAEALILAREISAMGTALEAESLRLSRKVSLLVHLLEEIRKFAGGEASPTTSVPSGHWSYLADLALSLEAVKKFLLLSAWHCVGGSSNLDSVAKKLGIQYQYVTWTLEKVLSNISYEHFEVSDEVQEEVELVRSQLRREIEKNGPSNLNVFEEMYNMLHSTNIRELKRARSFKLQAALSDSPCYVDLELRQTVIFLADVSGKYIYDTERMTLNLMDRLRRRPTQPDQSRNVEHVVNSTDPVSSGEDDQRSDSVVIPEDFLCPISLDRMKDPVIVSTGQTYERSSIQRWIDCGNQTCPKTRQKLDNLSLTPNYVLRSLILLWCEANEIKHPHRSVTQQRSGVASGKITGERTLIRNLVHKLTKGSAEEQRSAAAELRFLAKKNVDSRLLIVESGAIPALVGLLRADDKKTQEHAVTSLLNLSIHDHNKEEIMLAGAIVPMVGVLKEGSMVARENASAAIFSLSFLDENKITIGGTPGVIEALVELLENGSPGGKKDAASALFNLCIYEGNKSRAVRAGIMRPLLNILKDFSTSGLVDEVLIILSVLVSHHEGKAALSKANAISLLIDLLRARQPFNKENATALLFALCHKNSENLACVGRLGAAIPLTEIAKTGSERDRKSVV